MSSSIDTVLLRYFAGVPAACSSLASLEACLRTLGCTAGSSMTPVLVWSRGDIIRQDNIVAPDLNRDRGHGSGLVRAILLGIVNNVAPDLNRDRGHGSGLGDIITLPNNIARTRPKP